MWTGGAAAWNASNPLYLLERAQAVAQHHDAGACDEAGTGASMARGINRCHRQRECGILFVSRCSMTLTAAAAAVATDHSTTRHVCPP
jgi:hypothetical protein